MSAEPTSMYELYARYGGPENYYELLGDNYINPHEEDVRELVTASLRKWRNTLDMSSFTDLACGGGEVTLAINEIYVFPAPTMVNTGFIIR